jgi:Putative zinc-finger
MAARSVTAKAQRANWGSRVSSRPDEFAAGMPGLSHADAEQLISLRADTALPADQSRVLLAHLATCPSCRAFALSVETMGQGLRSLPMLAASPTVSRQVRERIALGQSPWQRFAHAMVGGRHGALPALGSAVALVAVIAFGIIVRGDNDNNGQADRTPIPAAIATDLAAAATATPTPTTAASLTPYVIRPADSTATVINVVAPKPSATATTEPAASDPTETATRTPRATRTPTATPTAAPPTSTPSETAQPSATPAETVESPASRTPEPIATSTQRPTRTPTATETSTPQATATPEPTGTETPRPTRTPTATETSTPEPTETRRPTRTPTATETSTPEPTETRRPTRTPTATEEPTTSGPPTIAPADNGGPSPGDDPTIEPDTPTEETTGDDPNSTQIQSIGNESPTPDGAVVDDPGIEETTPEPDQTVEASSFDETGPLDESRELANLGEGVSAPDGGLRVNADGNAIVVTLADGGLAVVDAEGNLLERLGSATTSIWSPRGLILLYSDIDTQSVATWDSTDGSFYSIGVDPGEGGPVADIAIGWIGSRLFYLRTFLDIPGSVEVHSAEYDGSDDRLVWIGEGIELVGERPVATGSVVLLPAADRWYLIAEDGTHTFTDTSGGRIGEPVLSPDGSIVTYSTGGGIAIASPADPGNPWVLVDYPDDFSGYAVSPSGAEIVVSDGATLRIYSTADGSLLGEAASLQGATATHPFWGDSGVRYLHTNGTTSLNLIDPAEFQ